MTSSKKQQQPVAVCTECGAYGHNMRNIGERCGKPNGARRCAGVRARATASAHWRECPKCAATGLDDGNECNVCLKSGWLYLGPTVRETPNDRGVT